MDAIATRVEKLVAVIKQLKKEHYIVGFDPDQQAKKLASILHASQPRFLEFPDKLLAEMLIEAINVGAEKMEVLEREPKSDGLDGEIFYVRLQQRIFPLTRIVISVRENVVSFQSYNTSFAAFK